MPQLNGLPIVALPDMANGTGLGGESSVPRILYITRHWPHKVSFAAELRAYHIRRALEQVGKVDVVVLDVEAGREDWSESAADNYKLADVLSVHSYENKGLAGKLRWALDPRSPHPQGRAVTTADFDRIVRRTDEYDLIWFEQIRSASMFPHWSWPNSILDIDDLPSAFETSVLKGDCGFGQRIMTWMRRESWRRREKLLPERFTTLVVCSENDKQNMERMGIDAPIHVVPNGFEDAKAEIVRSPATPPRIGFIGILDYFPNLEGIEWFVRQCWSQIRQKRPDAELRIVGRNADSLLKVHAPNITRLGWIEDVDSELATWSLMIVPIHKGAGTRAKIMLAFSRKCPVVSTKLGAHGYDVRDGDEILLADTPDAFTEACLKAIERPQDAQEMAERANQKFLQNWTWQAIQPRVWGAVRDCLARHGRKSGSGKVDA